MFTLLDGRECFYQWDSNVQLVVSDPTVNEVHFCNRTDDCSLVVEVKDRLVNVPNILLQSDYPIRVYAFCTNFTKVERIFKVCRRSKPADYLYEETDILSGREILVRAEETLDKANQALDGASDVLVEAREAVDSTDKAVSDSLNNAANAYDSEVKAAKSESNAAKSAAEALSNANKAKQSELNAQNAALDSVGAKDDVFEKLVGFDEKVESVNTNTEIASTAATEAIATSRELHDYAESCMMVLSDDDDGNVTITGITDTSMYATKEYVNTAISNSEFGSEFEMLWLGNSRAYSGNEESFTVQCLGGSALFWLVKYHQSNGEDITRFIMLGDKDIKIGDHCNIISANDTYLKFTLDDIYASLGVQVLRRKY